MDVKPIKMRARLKDGTASVKCLMPHPMETGVRKGLDGNPIPAHYIETVTCKHNGEVIIGADWGPSVSRDPYFAFEVAGAAAGDVIAVSWSDNQGNSTATDLTLEAR
jgi:sulfur-oxidizing protein SoxZ